MFKNKNTEEEEEVANDKLIGDNVRYDEDYYNNYIKQFTKRNRWNFFTDLFFYSSMILVLLLSLTRQRILYIRVLEAILKLRIIYIQKKNMWMIKK